MTAKSVWGVVLIVLGVIAVLTGIQDFAEVDQLDKIARWFIGAKYLHGSYEQAIQQAKIQLFVRIFIGIGLCFWGTWLIQDSQPTKERKEELPPLPKNQSEWGFSSEEEAEEFTRPTQPIITNAIPIYSDPKRPDVSKARCGACKKEFTYPSKRAGDLVPCPQCKIEFELP